MKQKIYVRLFDDAEKLTIKPQGEWIDLKTNEEINMVAPKTTKGKVDIDYQVIKLGVGMILPDGMEAHVLPRSSTFGKWGFILANSQGIIDNSYSGENDEWKYLAIALRDVNVPKGTAIAQFRIVPSQKATLWQRFKWLLSSGVEIVYIDKLNDVSRGGIGSTGDK